MDLVDSKPPAGRRGRPSKKAKTAVQQEGQSAGKESVSVVSQPRQKVTRGRKGRLSALIDMPVDILHEIFKHLLPYDILKLSRLNKQFRKLLLSKESRSIWRCGIENLDDFPSVPLGWNEPQWINLCYDPHCHFCLKTTCRTVEWTMRTRICTKCAKDLLEERYVPDPYWRSPEYVPYPLETLVLYKRGKRGRRSYLKTDLAKIKEEYNASPARASYVRERREFLEGVEAHALICTQWVNKQESNRSDELQALRDERRAAIVKELKAMGYAEELAGIQRPDSLENHELVKKAQRLTPRIWANIKGPLIEWLGEMRVKRLAREYQQIKRDRKLVAAEVLRKFKNERLPVTEAFPEVMDFCKFKPIAAVLELPADVTVDEASFTTEVMADVPDLIDAWQEKNAVSLVDMIYSTEREARRRSDMWRYIPSFCVDDDDDDGNYAGGDFPLDKTAIRDKLPLATTVFGCKGCTGARALWMIPGIRTAPSLYKPLFYPQVLNHQCTTRGALDLLFLAYGGYSSNEPAEKLEHHKQERRIGWSCRTITYQTEMAWVAMALVSAAGLDPKTTTTAEMDDSDYWFACHCCLRDIVSTTAQRATKAFKWRAAIQHFVTKHPNPETRRNEWACMTHEEVQELHQAYQDAGQDLSPIPPEFADKNLMCTHCRDLTTEQGPFILEDALTHVKEEHSIEDPQLNVDYFRTFEAGPEPPFMMDIAVMSVTLRNDVNLPESDSDEPAGPSTAHHWDSEEEYYDDSYDFYW